jgi:hypothetical protein
MALSWLRSPLRFIQRHLNWRRLSIVILSLILIVGSVASVNVLPAIANLNDDRYDGDIFALYAGNGSLIPPKVTLEQAFERKRPVLLVLYVDDSSDCKEYSTVVSQVQAFYGRAADLIPIRVDSIPQKNSYSKTEPGFYYKGFVPQTILFDETGKVVLDETGIIPFERLDDVLRELFNLLPRSESAILKRRPVNEINTELVQ